MTTHSFRKSDGTEVLVQHEDHGLVDGCYQSVWRFDGKEVVSRIDKDLAEIDTAFRLSEDFAMLKAHGLTPVRPGLK